MVDMLRWVMCACFMYISLVNAYTEILKNPDFEYTNVARDWSCQGGCTLTSSTDSYSRYHSVKVTNRHHSFNGPAQNVQLAPNTDYNFTGYIKITKLPPSAMYDTTELRLKCSTPSHPHGQYLGFGHAPFIPMGVWTQFGGVITIPSGAHSCHVYVQVKGTTTEYLLDHVSLHVHPDDSNWRTKANSRIEKYRKANITVKMVGGHGGNYDVELKQTSHKFAFGTAVNAQSMYDSAYKKYQDFVYENFEWAVLENALKWRSLERHHNQVNLTKALTAIHALRNHGIKVRGHNLVWGVQRHAPDWLQSLSHVQIETETEKHLKNVVGTTKGLLEHWDVNNENLHGDWYEQVTHDPNITIKYFNDVHTVDPNVKLFLNDFGIMQGDYAMALRDQARRFVHASAPIYGVGIQSHLKHFPLQMSVLEANLNTVADAGLPIWITELSVTNPSANVKATALKDVMTLYFSHPSVEGILLWGFSDQNIFDKSAALFEGTHFTPNAAGSVYQTLFNTTWRTHEHHSVDGHGTVHVRGFKGSYNLTVSHGGKHLTTEHFTLGSGGKTITVNVGSGSVSTIVG